MTLTEVTLDPFTNTHAAAHHATEAQACTTTAKTNHTTDPHHAGVSLEITVDPRSCKSSKYHYKTPKNHLPVQMKHSGGPRTGNTSKSPLMTCPQSNIALMNRTVIQRMI